jgi:Fur family ferric uptake transcriptional regulator
VSVLVGAGGAHLSAERIAELVQAQLPDVAESTIYRTLTALEGSGIVEHVHLGHGPSTYHLTFDPHHHLVCEQCERVIEVPDDCFAAVAAQLDERYGFEVSFRHFAILGRCRECRAGDGTHPGPAPPVPSA